MADVWAHGWDHWGWELWGPLCVPGCLLPMAHSRGLAGLWGVQHVLTAIHKPRLDQAWCWSICLQCVQLA